MKPPQIITFHEDGSATTLLSLTELEPKPFYGVGPITVRRASHIWPAHPVKRTAFRVLRSLFGERGRVAQWCRTWRGPWQVRFAASKSIVSFQHPSRRVCVDWEINQLNGRV